MYVVSYQTASDDVAVRNMGFHVKWDAIYLGTSRFAVHWNNIVKFLNATSHVEQAAFGRSAVLFELNIVTA